MNLARGFIAAAPGWSTITAVYGDGDEIAGLHVEPIIGWLVEFLAGTASPAETFAHPITAAPRGTDELHLVLRPDGSMFAVGELEVGTTTAAALEYLRHADAQKRAQRERTAAGAQAAAAPARPGQ